MAHLAQMIEEIIWNLTSYFHCNQKTTTKGQKLHYWKCHGSFVVS